jgi:hypothetical protein
VTEAFRASGGSAFIVLTDKPTIAAVAFLAQRGLLPAPNRDRIMTFDSLGLKSVWGTVPPNGVEIIARITFVTGIEPSTEPIGHGIQQLSPVSPRPPERPPE